MFDRLSVIIATCNRADYLRRLLESLIRQTLPRDRFEIILIDDGSTDGTGDLAADFQNRLNLSYFRQDNRGAAAARNAGIERATGPLLVFLDDDDFAAPDLLAQHLKAHRKYPEENMAVLNYTTWAPELERTPLMDFIVGEGELLFSYGSLKHGDILDYRFFWMGRSSCKRSFLLKHGVFNPQFQIFEDVDLPFRLSKHGLKVVYSARAVTYMMRSFEFDDFCRRCTQQGRAYYLCALLHPEQEIQQFCLMEGVNRELLRIKHDFESLVHYARELDQAANRLLRAGIPLTPAFKKTLNNAYGQAFLACRLKGIAEERKKIKPIQASRDLTNLRDRIAEDFVVVAVICAYNEGDVIYHVLEHLVQNGIYVYLLDHHSTDDTVEQASRWLGRGLLHIERFPDESGCPEGDKDTFSLHLITRRVEQLHSLLGADWYIHYDADEFRDPPWPGMTMKEAIHLVDVLGFNAINFEYLNFWPTDNSFVPGEDVRKYIRYYEPAEEWDKPRVNAWKNFGQEVDLTAFMGHKVCFPGIKVFPLQFINRHYRIRSQEHGLRKVYRERLARFDAREKAGGSHLQYDDLPADVRFVKDPKEVTLYDPDQVRAQLNFKAAFNAGKF